MIVAFPKEWRAAVILRPKSANTILLVYERSLQESMKVMCDIEGGEQFWMNICREESNTYTVCSKDWV